jgi:hypothetical protein
MRRGPAPVGRGGRGRSAVALFTALFCLALVGVAVAKPVFLVRESIRHPEFHAHLNSCVKQFQRAGGLARHILSQLNGAEVILEYTSSNGGATDNPAPNGNSTGKPVTILWDSGTHGVYADKAPLTPCSVLLHELEHAARFFLGQECTGTRAENIKAYDYDEDLGARAENWWLRHLGKRLRMSYEGRPLPGWTRSSARDGGPVPPPPPCMKSSSLPEITLGVQVAFCGGGRNGPRTSTVTVSPAGKPSVDATGDTAYSWYYAHAPADATFTLTAHPGPGCGPPRWQYASGSLWAGGTCNNSSYMSSCTVVADPRNCPCFGNAYVSLDAIFPTSTAATADRTRDQSALRRRLP